MTHRNAELLLRAKTLGTGKVTPLTRGERAALADYSLAARPLGRAWEYWVTRLTKAGELPPSTKTRVGGKGGKAEGEEKAAKKAGKRK